MSTGSDHADLTQAFIDAYNTRDWERMRTLLAPGCVHQEIAKPARRVEGVDRILELFQAWARAAPDPTGEVTSIVADGGGSVAAEIRWVGSIQGPFGDFTPTGKPQEIMSAFFCTVTDGQFAEFRHYFDSLAVFQVLGVRP